MKFIFCLGLFSMKYGRPETYACGKNDVICYLGNDMICRFFDKKRPKTFYDAKLTIN
jgi:hypothetical protein